MKRSSARAAATGPTVIEAVTYRLSDHTTADDASRYRADAGSQGRVGCEPLLRVRAAI